MEAVATGFDRKPVLLIPFLIPTDREGVWYRVLRKIVQ